MLASSGVEAAILSHYKSALHDAMLMCVLAAQVDTHSSAIRRYYNRLLICVLLLVFFLTTSVAGI